MNKQDWQTLVDYVQTRTSQMHGDGEPLKQAFYEALEEVFEVFDERSGQSHEDGKIAPSDCDHARLFVYGSYGGAFHTNENVSVCKKCGQFEVSIARHVEEPGIISDTITFLLPTKDLVCAAGQFARFIAQEDKS